MPFQVDSGCIITIEAFAKMTLQDAPQFDDRTGCRSMPAVYCWSGARLPNERFQKRGKVIPGGSAPEIVLSCPENALFRCITPADPHKEVPKLP